jgi:hypothetical protein
MAFKSTTSATTYANAKAMKDAQVEGGTIAQAGNLDVTEATGIPDRPIKNQIALADMNADDDSDSLDQGSRVVSNDGTGASTTDRVGVAKAVTGGTLAFNPAPADRTASDPQFIIRGVSTSVGGVSNTVLHSAGSHYPSNNTRTQERIKIQDRVLGSGELLDINVEARPSTEIHPERTKSADVGDRLTFHDPEADSAATVSAQESTRAIPGKLTYMFGGKLAKKDQYKASDAYEG